VAIENDSPLDFEFFVPPHRAGYDGGPRVEIIIINELSGLKLIENHSPFNV
jgi:hypothetical protein